MIFFLFICYWLGLSLRYSYAIAIVIIAILIILFLKKNKKVAMLCLAVVLVGVGISNVSILIPSNPSTHHKGLIIDSHTNYFILFSKGERLYVYQKDNPYEIGDYLSIDGDKEKIDFVSNESQFDFEDYLNKKGIYYYINVKSIEVEFSNPIRIKAKREKFLSHFNEKQQTIISSLLFSERIEGEDLVSSEKLHLLRLMNASGIYIHAYLALLVFILSKFIKDKHSKIIALLVLVPYFIFTFPRFSIIRIFVMEVVRWLNKYKFKRKFNRLSLVSLVGLGFLIFDYHFAYQTSFIMGFLLPILVIFINDATYDLKKIKKKIAVTIFIYLALIPFELMFYNGINPLSPILITVLSPLFIVIAISSLFSFYGLPIYRVVGSEIQFVSKILNFLSKFAFQINTPPMNEWMLLIYGFLFVGVLYYRSIRFIPIYKPLVALFILGLAIYHLPIINFVTVQVSFIDVGQGDSCLIRKGNTSVLIDTGGNQYKDLAMETLIPFFEKQRIYNIDLVIATHGDYDHIGAYDSLNENFYVKNLVTEASSFPITIGGMTFKNYNNHTSNNDENDNSLVIGFRLMDKDFLITGDASIAVEKQIMQEYKYIPCDILKVGHHGSKTSSSEEFIKYLSPKDAIISVGKNNKYGHPNEIVLTTLKRYDVNILRTDELGTITYKSFCFS